jgi:hypothetical protein
VLVDSTSATNTTGTCCCAVVLVLQHHIVHTQTETVKAIILLEEVVFVAPPIIFSPCTVCSGCWRESCLLGFLTKDTQGTSGSTHPPQQSQQRNPLPHAKKSSKVRVTIVVLLAGHQEILFGTVKSWFCFRVPSGYKNGVPKSSPGAWDDYWLVCS